MNASKELGSVNIYMDFIDGQGVVTDSVLIATCKNKRYAEIILEGLEKRKDKHDSFNFRTEVV